MGLPSVSLCRVKEMGTQMTKHKIQNFINIILSIPWYSLEISGLAKCKTQVSSSPVNIVRY